MVYKALRACPTYPSFQIERCISKFCSLHGSSYENSTPQGNIILGVPGDNSEMYMKGN